MRLKNPILNILVPSEMADDLSYLLHDVGALAIEERDHTTLTATADGRVMLVAGFETGDARRAARVAVEAAAIDAVEIAEVDEIDEDWQTRWREFFEPVVLRRLQVITPWMSPPRTDRITVTIDPGQAFGTGGHATTKLILEMLEEMVEQGDLPARILDVGTGSGILAFAARKLGAAEVFGVDIDPESIAAFYENAERNGIDTGLVCRQGSAGDAEGTWPLVLANIQIDAFRRCASDVSRRVALGGRLLVSGILLDQVAECLSLFPGFSLSTRRDEGEWSALCLVPSS